jgi:hypothetical protein
MMDWMFGSAAQGPIYTLVIVVIIFGLILIYLSYMILSEIREMNRALERIRKVLESVE